MSVYQPFLIADYKTAKAINKESWLLPKDAFPVLENMRVNKGVLEKRLGFSPFAQMKHGATPKTDTAITGIHTYLRRGMPSLLFMDTKRANYYDPVNQTTVDVSSDLTTPADIFSGSADDFFSFLNVDGVGYMVNNQDQIHKWEGPGTAVVPFDIQINTTDDKANHVDTCQYLFLIDDRIVLLGTVEFGDFHPNRLRYSPVGQTDFSAAGSGRDNAETQGRITAAIKIRKTVYAFFEEGDKGSLWKIRRTGDADVPLEWDRVSGADWSRSPHSGIEFNDGMAAIGNGTILFVDGTTIKPIKQIDIPNVRDIVSEFSESFIRSVFGYYQKENNEKHLLFTFAASGSSAVDRIVDFNVNENNYTVYKSNQSFFLNIIGGASSQVVPTFVQLDDVVTEDGDIVSNVVADSREVFEGTAQLTLIGGRNSRIYKWNDGAFDGTDDSSGNIPMAATTIRYNPFIDKGRKVACEKIGFYVDNDANASFLVSMFKNTKTADTVIGSDLNQYRCILAHTSSTDSRPVTGSDYTTHWEATGKTGVAETWVTATVYSGPYKNKVISCDADDDTVDKFWVWIFCDGEEGNFHEIKISHTARSNRPRIHAHMPYFASAGRLDLG